MVNAGNEAVYVKFHYKVDGRWALNWFTDGHIDYFITFLCQKSLAEVSNIMVEWLLLLLWIQ
jgi:hypothetical protein